MVSSYAKSTHGCQWKWPNYSSCNFVENIVLKSIPTSLQIKHWRDETPINQHIVSWPKFRCCVKVMVLSFAIPTHRC
jgi:hypothetical protein